MFAPLPFSCLWSWRGFQSGKKQELLKKFEGGRYPRSSDEPWITKDEDEKGGEGCYHGISCICLPFKLPLFFCNSSLIFLWETTASHPSSNGRRCEWITVDHQLTYQPQWLAEGWARESSSSQRLIFVGLIWFVTTFKKEPLLACVLNVISFNPLVILSCVIISIIKTVSVRFFCFWRWFLYAGNSYIKF